MSKHHHLYNSARWRTSRLAFLGRNPTCRMCADAGRVTVATVVDHCIPHRGDVGLFWDARNWQALCAPCHSGAKQSTEATGKPLRGCDVTGRPLDPSHPWNREGA